MAIAFVNGNIHGTSSSVTSIATDATSATTGNALVVFVTTYSTVAYRTVSGIDDTASNGAKFALCGSRYQYLLASTYYINVECWVAPNITGNASNIITASFTTADTGAEIGSLQYSGMATSSPYDTGYDPAGNVDSAQPYTTTADSTAENNEIVCGFFIDIAGGASPTYSNSGSSVLRVQVTPDHSYYGLTDIAAASAGSISVAMGSDRDDTTLCFAKAFKQAAAAASIEQKDFRFRNDDNNESAATWKASQDTNITLAADTAFRLRFLLKATGNPDSIDAQAEARVKPSGGAFGSWEKIN